MSIVQTAGSSSEQVLHDWVFVMRFKPSGSSSTRGVDCQDGCLLNSVELNTRARMSVIASLATSFKWKTGIAHFQ